MNTLADDPEAAVRSDLIEQTPHLAICALEYPDDLDFIVPKHLLPLVIKFLNDANPQVRKTAQAALLVLIEQELVEIMDLKEQVFHVIIHLTEPSNKEENRMEAIALLSKMAPLIGKKITESVFLNLFASLCLDSVFSVRKVCAANIGDLCQVIGSNSTERVLLPRFYHLCSDGSWGVRKACADVFMSVSVVCSPYIRRTKLSSQFVSLLQDSSRWVRMAAFQCLGHFISTFADPSITSLLRHDNGEIVIENTKLFVQRLEELENARAAENDSQQIKSTAPLISSAPGGASTVITSSLNVPKPASEMHSSPSQGSFNSFQFWREPVMHLDVEQLELTEDDDDDEEDAIIIHPLFEDKVSGDLPQSYFVGRFLEDWKNDASFANLLDSADQEDVEKDSGDVKLSPLEKILPESLIYHYVSMTDPSRAQTIDSEITKHCAYALPAVALTIGRSNWPYLKETYESLAVDMQWKVRRTLASSIHELSLILGPHYAVSDLIPVFNAFLKDLDEVRIGILKHLYDFLKVLPVQERRGFLPRFSEFLKIDNERNWRFRQELAIQLGYLVPLYEPDEVQQYMAPIGVELIKNKVSTVRCSAVTLLTEIIAVLLKSGNHLSLATSTLDELTSLASSNRWVHRQVLCQLCWKLFKQWDMDHSLILDNILPALSKLAEDKVPNVRLVVARTICQIQSSSCYRRSVTDMQKKQVVDLFVSLSSDQDADVKYCFNQTENQ